MCSDSVFVSTLTRKSFFAPNNKIIVDSNNVLPGKLSVDDFVFGNSWLSYKKRSCVDIDYKFAC